MSTLLVYVVYGFSVALACCASTFSMHAGTGMYSAC